MERTREKARRKRGGVLAGARLRLPFRYPENTSLVEFYEVTRGLFPHGGLRGGGVQVKTLGETHLGASHEYWQRNVP